MEKLDQLRALLLGAVESAGTPAELEQVRISALGKKGAITSEMKTLSQLSPEMRRHFGAALNTLKDQVAEALEVRKAAFESVILQDRLEKERLDVTLPIRPEAEGTVHPVSQVFDEAVAVFAQMGFSVAEGPEIEDDFHNFTALNFPPGHPAREAHDTFFFQPRADGSRHLLRTHTSPVQIRTMMTQKPPIRVIIPGRTYRCDSDMTHTPVFNQIEGLVIDTETHMGHLKACLREFVEAFFEISSVPMRFRPSFFPFTEPSMEIDIACSRKGGSLKIGSGEGWLEIAGSGMVHPKVLQVCGLDPQEYQGFAFGMGLERIAMLKYGIPDLRTFFEPDLRWLRHYGFAPLEVPTLSGGLSR